MNSMLARRLERLEASIPPRGGEPHEHDAVRIYQLGEAPATDAALEAAIAVHYRPCTCKRPGAPAALVVTDGGVVRRAEDAGFGVFQ